MTDDNKDNLVPAASTETTATAEAQVKPEPISAPAGTPDKVYAGKFKTADELEKSYKELESKVGSKSFTEKLGDRVVKATGYSLPDLQTAGYTEDQIVQAMLSHQETGEQQMPQAATTQNIREDVTAAKLHATDWKLSTMEFYSDNPDAKAHKVLLEDLHKVPAYKDMIPEELFNAKVRPMLDHAQETTLEQQTVKEKASLNLSSTTTVDPDKSAQAVKVWQKTGYSEDAARILEARGIV